MQNKVILFKVIDLQENVHRSEVSGRLQRVSIKDVSVPSISPSALTNFLIPADEQHPHTMTLPPLCFPVGMVLSAWLEV